MGRSHLLTDDDNQDEDEDEDTFAISTFAEMLEEASVFEFPSWPTSLPDSFLHEFVTRSPTPGIHDDSAPSSPTSSNEAATPANTPVSTPTSSRQSVSLKAKRYRRRKREEMERLRDTVKTLEVRLAALKARPPPGEASLGPYPHIWEAIAIRESTSRQEAERENKELRETIEVQLQLAHKLDHVLKKITAQSGLMGYSEETST